MSSAYDSDEDNHNVRTLQELSALTNHIMTNLYLASQLCEIENQQITTLESEHKKLLQQKSIMEKQTIETKLLRWCTRCLEKAIYLGNNNKFYCCSKCEQLDKLLSDGK